MASLQPMERMRNQKLAKQILPQITELDYVCTRYESAHCRFESHIDYRSASLQLLFSDSLICQQAVAGISHISFAEEESVSPRKPTSLPEVAKQRELSGTLESEADAKLKKQLSDAKCKELSGHDIFAPPPEILPRPTTARALDLKGSIDIGEPASRNVCTSVKVSNGSGLCGWMHVEIRHFLPQLLMIFLRNIMC